MCTRRLWARKRCSPSVPPSFVSSRQASGYSSLPQYFHEPFEGGIRKEQSPEVRIPRSIWILIRILQQALPCAPQIPVRIHGAGHQSPLLLAVPV